MPSIGCPKGNALAPVKVLPRRCALNHFLWRRCQICNRKVMGDRSEIKSFNGLFSAIHLKNVHLNSNLTWLTLLYIACWQGTFRLASLCIYSIRRPDLLKISGIHLTVKLLLGNCYRAHLILAYRPIHLTWIQIVISSVKLRENTCIKQISIEQRLLALQNPQLPAIGNRR